MLAALAARSTYAALTLAYWRLELMKYLMFR